MKKQFKRVLAVMLSVMVALSLVPTALFASAAAGIYSGNVTYSSPAWTYQNATDMTITANSPLTGVSLTTQFTNDTFSERKENNLVKNATSVVLYRENGTAAATADAAVIGRLTDGVLHTHDGTNSIETGVWGNPGPWGVCSETTATDGTGYQGRLVVALDKEYIISDIYGL